MTQVLLAALDDAAFLVESFDDGFETVDVTVTAVGLNIFECHVFDSGLCTAGVTAGRRVVVI
eukprot:5330776-Pleurochrysis_carterae.AAC.1